MKSMIGRILAPLLRRFQPRPSGSAGVFRAARDMRDYERIRDLVHWADDELERGGLRELTLDLARLVRMDTSFLAGVVLVCRRARKRNVAVRIVRKPKHFDTLVDLYRIRGALIEAGVIFDDADDDRSDRLPHHHHHPGHAPRTDQSGVQSPPVESAPPNDAKPSTSTYPPGGPAIFGKTT